MKNKAIALIEIGALVSSCQTAPKVVAELGSLAKPCVEKLV